jgi:hypothetical protein
MYFLGDGAILDLATGVRVGTLPSEAPLAAGRLIVPSENRLMIYGPS